MPREVLVPGSLLPDKHKQPGKLHGVVTRTLRKPGGDIAVIKLSDVRGVQVQLPLDAVKSMELLPRKQARRDRAPRPSRAKAPPPRRRKPKNGEKEHEPLPRAGLELVARLQSLAVSPSASLGPVGTRVWVTLKRGAPRWPGILWCVSRARPGDIASLVDAHERAVRAAVVAAGDGAPPPPPPVLVLFFGEATLGWVRPDDVAPFDGGSAAARADALVSACRATRNAAAAAAAAHQVGLSLADPAAEAARAAASRAAALDARAKAAHPPCAACGDVVPLEGPGAAAAVTCLLGCMASYHTVCLPPCARAGTPALATADLPGGGAWTCPGCATHTPAPPAKLKPGASSAVDRQGLTPDWMIQAAVHVFGLAMPTADTPYIKGLLDPCSNNRACPNIPAEKIYTKNDDGLRLSNSWESYHILLNAPFQSAVAWRFVNRALDAVENRESPATIMILRNSTDTRYWERLRPYPKVFLKRNAACFKDYSNTPIGFGIAVVLLVRDDVPWADTYTHRFIAAFGPHGEPCLAIDTEFAASPAYAALLTRLRDHTDDTRDHWAKCGACGAWRKVSRAVAARVAQDDAWTCDGGCGVPLTRDEAEGVHYAPACGAPDDNGRQIGDVIDDGGAMVDRQVDAGQPAPPPAAPTTPRAAARPRAPPSPPPPTIQPADVVVLDEAAVKRAARLPPRPRWAAADDDSDAEGEADIITALELARAARIAANKAFLVGLGLVTDAGAPTAAPAELPCLPPDHPGVLIAARELARQAAAATATAQLESVRAAARGRAEERARRREVLQAELASIAAAESMDAAELKAAEDAAREAGGS